jgi:hypothetical protein
MFPSPKKLVALISANVYIDLIDTKVLQIVKYLCYIGDLSSNCHMSVVLLPETIPRPLPNHCVTELLQATLCISNVASTHTHLKLVTCSIQKIVYKIRSLLKSFLEHPRRIKFIY